MARRTKRSVSLPSDLAQEIDRAATRSGTTFSGWLAKMAAHRLRLETGRRALAAWEREHGPLTADERPDAVEDLIGNTTHLADQTRSIRSFARAVAILRIAGEYAHAPFPLVTNAAARERSAPRDQR